MTIPTFSSGYNFAMGLGKANLPANRTVATFNRCRNIKGNPKFWKAPLAQDNAHFYLWCNFMMGLGKPKLRAKFKVASFNRAKNIIKELQNFGELP